MSKLKELYICGTNMMNDFQALETLRRGLGRATYPNLDVSLGILDEAIEEEHERMLAEVRKVTEALLEDSSAEVAVNIRANIDVYFEEADDVEFMMSALKEVMPLVKVSIAKGADLKGFEDGIADRTVIRIPEIDDLTPVMLNAILQDIRSSNTKADVFLGGVLVSKGAKLPQAEQERLDLKMATLKARMEDEFPPTCIDIDTSEAPSDEYLEEFISAVNETYPDLEVYIDGY